MSADEFERELAATINRSSQENPSNTPDWILAIYLRDCLSAFNIAVQQREAWYGRDPRPSEAGAPIQHVLPAERVLLEQVDCLLRQRDDAFRENQHFRELRDVCEQILPVLNAARISTGSLLPNTSEVLKAVATELSAAVANAQEE